MYCNYLNTIVLSFRFYFFLFVLRKIQSKFQYGFQFKAWYWNHFKLLKLALRNEWVLLPSKCTKTHISMCACVRMSSMTDMSVETGTACPLYFFIYYIELYNHNVFCVFILFVYFAAHKDLLYGYLLDCLLYTSRCV